ncbi:hypothetical protein, partial [Frankia sp. Cj3]|uniref:hypothetical protein n=1 Tax=Frankia sp. Cj3 TaxID=2880976 RepID=UPI001EF4A9C5
MESSEQRTSLQEKQDDRELALLKERIRAELKQGEQERKTSADRKLQKKPSRLSSVPELPGQEKKNPPVGQSSSSKPLPVKASSAELIDAVQTQESKPLRRFSLLRNPSSPSLLQSQPKLVSPSPSVTKKSPMAKRLPVTSVKQSSVPVLPSQSQKAAPLVHPPARLEVEGRISASDTVISLYP